MTKSELIEIITAKQKHLPAKDVELALKQMLEIMSDSLAQGDRIEIRGFGSFSLHFRPPRQGRNPKTGEAVALAGKYVPHFKPGKDLRERVNSGADQPDPRLSEPDTARSLASKVPIAWQAANDSDGGISRGRARHALPAGHQGQPEGDAADRRQAADPVCGRGGAGRRCPPPGVHHRILQARDRGSLRYR